MEGAMRGRRGSVVKRSTRSQFRFPCGHLEGEVTARDRMRRSRRAAWVPCRVCNVIALVVGDAGHARVEVSVEADSHT
jgi:head-tail adaptor